jgi:hypothetical protein
VTTSDSSNQDSNKPIVNEGKLFQSIPMELLSDKNQFAQMGFSLQADNLTHEQAISLCKSLNAKLLLWEQQIRSAPPSF